jgi:hypothetical protein
MSYFKKTILTDNYGFSVENTPMDELRAVIPTRLVGATFADGPAGAVDPNFWTATVGGVAAGTAATVARANNQVTLSAQTKSDGSAVLQTIRKARYTGGSSNRYRGQIRLGDIGLANNTKRWGMFDGTDGAYFKLAGTALSVNTMKAGSETSVASASWNGSTTTPTLTNVNSYEIYITNSKVYFVIAGVLVHTVTASTTTWADTTNLPSRTDNINSGNTTNTIIEVRVATIYRLGQLETSPQYGRITTATTYVFKYGAGMLHRLTINLATGTTIKIYDGTSATTLIADIAYGAKNDIPTTLEYMMPFSTGLTVVTTGTWDATIIYE